MAIYRPQPKCPKCGGFIDGVYQNVPNFYGDSFIRWDYAGHKCNPIKAFINWLKTFKK